MPALRPRSASPPSTRREALERAQILSKQLSASKIATRVTESGDLMLDMTGYKSSDDQALRAEVVARKILAEELQGNYDIGALIGADEQGNLWIYSSEEAKEAAQDRSIPLEDRSIPLEDRSIIPLDAASDPGHASDDGRPSHRSGSHRRSDSDAGPSPTEPVTNYAKTLRLTSDQLKALQLTPGPNPVSFTVNRATCHAHLYLWRHDQPVVISDIDGTITKSDALGQVLNLLGRDWTHVGVAKLYSEIVANGYDIIYLTSRSVGQADTTRAYLQGVVQDGYRLPRGPTIMSPDRTIAALRRELYIRKPEVFKMACLRDIKSLFGSGRSPFYAGFGNRLTDALSYRSVAIPSNRIFTINSNAEVSLDLLALNKLKLSYVNMREVVDHYFPPVGLLVRGGGEDFTDFTYWREDLVDLSLSGESDGEGEGEVSGDDGGDGDDRANEDGVDGRPYDMDGRAYDIDGIDINGIDIDGDGDGMDDSFLSDQSQPYDAHDDGGLTTAA
jgi:phosphatidate phosphatase LPIN